MSIIVFLQYWRHQQCEGNKTSGSTINEYGFYERSGLASLFALATLKYHEPGLNAMFFQIFCQSVSRSITQNINGICLKLRLVDLYIWSDS